MWGKILLIGLEMLGFKVKFRVKYRVIGIFNVRVRVRLRVRYHVYD